MADRPTSALGFKAMSFCFRIRDLFSSPVKMLREAGVVPGQCVLDYGCGPGSYTLAAAELVGEAGKVCALDIHPLAIRSVRRAAAKRGLTNVETTLSDCATGLERASVDVVLLYDVFHGLGDPGAVLRELHRVLKPGGVLSFSDHHVAEGLSKVTRGGLFRLSRKGERTYSFIRAEVE